MIRCKSEEITFPSLEDPHAYSFFSATATRGSLLRPARCPSPLEFHCFLNARQKVVPALDSPGSDAAGRLVPLDRNAPQGNYKDQNQSRDSFIRNTHFPAF